MPVLNDLKDGTSDKINENDSKLLIDISFQDKVQLIYPQYKKISSSTQLMS